jgi:gamma-glutamyltranspeptidase/glutathione hydrolase
MVVAQEGNAARAGAEVLREGGSAVDAAVATAFALAVTHPIAGNLGGGGFLLARPAKGAPAVFDFREAAPARAHPRMWLKEGAYDAAEHHDSLRAVGVPGSVAGLHAAWKAAGRLPWRRLLEPARRLAEDGFPVSPELSRAFKKYRPDFEQHGPTWAAFSRGGAPYEPGEILRQPDLARTLARLQAQGPRDFYRGETARLLAGMMAREGGLVGPADLAAYRVKVRAPLAGKYRGLAVLTVPPPSGGGIALLEMLNILEGVDLAGQGHLSPVATHLTAEAMRAAYRDRARWVGDPAFAPGIPVARLISKPYAAGLRKALDPGHAAPSTLDGFEIPEPEHTTHLSVVDREGNAVSLTTTLEDDFGVKRIVPGAGFLLNNELGDFNAVPGLTDASGKIGTRANLARPGARPLSSMSPAILAKAGRVVMVTGSPGGRTIPNTTLHTILNAVDFRMDAQEAVDAPRFHHQWFPDRIQLEPGAAYPAGLKEALQRRGHRVTERDTRQGVAQVILVQGREPRGGADAGRWGDSTVAVE